MSKERIVRYTAEELAKMHERGESPSDWAKVGAMPEEDLKASIAADPDSDIPPEAWDDVIIGLPDFIEPKKHINLRVDMDVWRWFKGQGKGYQTRMNAVLRSYMLAQRNREHRHHHPDKL